MDEYYKILNVNEGDNYDKIKKSYRQLQMKNHPDKDGDEEMFIKINEAYKKITNHMNKKSQEKEKPEENNIPDNLFKFFLNKDLISNIYNLSSNKNKNSQNDLNNIDILNDLGNISNYLNISSNNLNDINKVNNDIFNDIFKINNNNNNNIKKAKPPPIIKNIEITLTEAYKGKKHSLTIERWYLENNIKVKEKENIYIDIYPGIDNNELIILKNKGNIINEDNIGDVKIFVKINNNTIFKRDGLNLIYEKNVTLKEALLGFSFKLTHLSGKSYIINNTENKIINVNHTKNIENMGMIRNNIKGILIIKLNIIFPENLTKEQKEKISEIL